MVEVRLSWEELTNAGVLGVLRRVSGIRNGRGELHRALAETAWSRDIDGIAAEMAVAKYLGTYWQPLAADDDLRPVMADIGSTIQVRSTARRDGSLIVHPADPDDHLFYLVVTAAPRYVIVGWMLGHRAKQPRYWREDVRSPAFFVPQGVLSGCDNGVEAMLR